jgi:hypothetical protein
LPSDEPGRGSVGRRGDRALDRSGDGSFTTLTSTSLDDGHPGTRSGVTVMMRRRVAVIHLRDALALLCEAGPYQLAAGRSLYRPHGPQRRLPRAAGHVGRGPARREPPGRGTRRRSGVGGASGPLLALPAQHGAGPVRVAPLDQAASAVRPGCTQSLRRAAVGRPVGDGPCVRGWLPGESVGRLPLSSSAPHTGRQTQPRSIAEVLVARQNRRPMASWCVTRCGHASQFGSSMSCGVGRSDRSRRTAVAPAGIGMVWSPVRGWITGGERLHAPLIDDVGRRARG